MTTAMVEKCKIAMQDNDFLNEIIEAKSAQKLSEILAKKDIVMTDEEVETFHKALKSSLDNDSELNVDVLDNVSGGIGIIGGAVGTLVAIALGGWLGGRSKKRYC